MAGVEAQAIKDRCLHTQFKGLIFVQLERSVKLPDWLPQTHVRFNMADFGMEQLIGAIKARVIDGLDDPATITHQLSAISLVFCLCSDAFGFGNGVQRLKLSSNLWCKFFDARPKW